MKYIYSRTQPDKLLHLCITKQDLIDSSPRKDWVPVEHELQIASLSFPAGQKFLAHKHIRNERMLTHTLECWLVVDGKVKVYYYDFDDTIISTEILNPGDLTATVTGDCSHNYEFLEGGLVYEIKVGNYIKGFEGDKVRIE